MKCEDVLEILAAHRDDDDDGDDDVEYRRAARHAAECGACRDAARALRVLDDERRRSVPAPRPDALTRAVRAAAGSPRQAPAPRGRAGFWAGVAVGGAVAAGIALAVMLFEPFARMPAGSEPPMVTAALDEVRRVDLELASSRRLEDAEIRVVLDGAIELDGYAGRRELSWRTDLAAGANQLTLPVIVRAPEGGRLRVVVRTGERTRSFRFDLRADGAAERVGRRDGTEDAPSRV